MSDLAHLDATESAAMVRDGDVAAHELVEAAIERIERVNPDINAVIHPLFDRARETVKADRAQGPFRGVPILVKDLDGYLEGAPLHMGNVALRDIDYRADHTSYLFRRLEAAGFVIVGKTNTPEFGLLPTAEPDCHGATRNPWNPQHSSGGSSGGSAAAVAAGLVPLAHAGDGGGSIRIPASMCALFGLKPNRGRVSLGPAEGEDWAGFVQRHVVTRSVRDSAAVLDVLQGPESGDPYTAPPPARPYVEEIGADPGRLRIGIRTEASGGLAVTDPICTAATERLASMLEALGHTVEVASPKAFDEAEVVLTGFLTVLQSSVLAKLRWLGEKLGREVTSDDVEPDTWASAEAGRALSGADYVAARDSLFSWSRRVASWWTDEGFDLLVTPTLASPPPPLGHVMSTPEDPSAATVNAMPFAIYTVPFNITGQPAMSIPVDWTDADLPIGVQLVADQYREDLLLRVASQLESGPLAASGRSPRIHA